MALNIINPVASATSKEVRGCRCQRMIAMMKPIAQAVSIGVLWRMRSRVSRIKDSLNAICLSAVVPASTMTVK